MYYADLFVRVLVAALAISIIVLIVAEFLIFISHRRDKKKHIKTCFFCKHGYYKTDVPGIDWKLKPYTKQRLYFAANAGTYICEYHRLILENDKGYDKVINTERIEHHNAIDEER